MQFYSPYFLNLLWLVPVLVLCFMASSWLQAKRLRAFLKTKEIQGKLLPHYQHREWPLRAICLLAAFIFSVLALSQPQWGDEKRRVERKGVDLIFLLDVSTSMLAEDIKPSRVRKAKYEIEAFVKALKGHRIGMLTFAGSSFMQTPLTLDYSAFLIFLSGVEVGHVPDPGTLLGPAILKAIDAFPDDKGKHRALIVFSDGEDHEPDLISALDAAKKKSVRIYAVGTATADGAPIPLKNSAGVQAGVKKNREGNIVITKLNKETLGKIATETGGVYLPATPGEKEVDLILKHLATLGEKKLEDRLITEKEDHFQIFVFLALMCLLLEMLVRRTTAPFGKLLSIPALFFIFILHSGFIPTAQNKVEEGNRDFEGKKYQSAITKYREVQVKNPDAPPVNYNLATTLYKVDQFQESAANLKKAMDQSAKDPELQAKAAYNYGNALYRVGDYEGAIAAYKKALELNPHDQDAKYNLEFIQNQKDKFEKENQDRKKDNPQKKDDKNQQQNQQQNQQNQGGGSNQDKNQGQSDQKDQQGSGENKQDQNQGGQGESQQNSGQNQNQDQKDQGKRENQQDQSQGNQSDQQKEQNQQSSGQDQKENQQNQKSDSQNKGDQQGQDKQPDPSSQQNQNQGGTGQQDQEKQDKGEPEKEDPNQQGQESQGEGNQPDQKDAPQGEPQTPPQKPQGEGQKPGQQGTSSPQPSQGAGGGGQPLQGQMTKENAEYLLAALEDGEKKFQIMRKPPEDNMEPPYVEKDW